MKRERSVDAYPLEKRVHVKDARDYVFEQSVAFGVLFLILSLVMAVAMLNRKHPVGMERAICWATGVMVDWRSWMPLAVGFLLVAAVCLLRRLQR
ncbi:hypothetical protein HI806_23130 (plasmid) [Ralstonia solanacearum]|uniref:Transmembrane protein n=2 Tax=Ralstonia solanacearum species complex TaxID=3116862 RepID=A0A454TLZ0_9RALS|nr:hypothetical protein [Ralstonia pseudosolanacearum]ANH35950.1 hypothetical protein A3768_5157 [Ralstonia solanacearum]APF89300.1 hypothetical protein BCR16_20990 [Ralstonia solanacearum FJAT-1458]AGH86730.1 putative transmembrane protein [Ralstonia pseudosolanacearum FQY_4]AOE93034.1 hypothetical protein LBM341_04785 [Ralstonia solanacearum]AUS45225.1 hypothetical protein CYD94_24500 [Ralstonia solanacearum]